MTSTLAENSAVVEELTDQIVTKEASVEAPPKRRRGRPAKAMLTPTITAQSGDLLESTAPATKKSKNSAPERSAPDTPPVSTSGDVTTSYL